jgi:serine/threonine-protein kinase
MESSRLNNEDTRALTTRFKGEQRSYRQLTAGTLVDHRYEIVELVGLGGVSSVYLARDNSLNGEEIVLKILSPDLANDPECFSRFKNEVVLSRRLAHPHITRVFDFGKAEPDMNYYVLEYVDGGNLWSLVQRSALSRLNFADTIKVLLEVALALDYAHRNGVLHRDVKPENILLTSDGVAKLSDFGAARVMRIEKGITGPGAAIGTPHYMAPEALRGEKTDERSDIYSFGIMAFEIVAGYPPFDDESPLVLVTKQVNETLPQISYSGAEVPDWYQDFLEICTAKKSIDRFQSVSELIEVLWNNAMASNICPELTLLPNCLQPSRKPERSNKGVFSFLRNR